MKSMTWPQGGECRKVDARMLLLDIVSLNIFSFMAAPLVNTLMGSATDDYGGLRRGSQKEKIPTQYYAN